MSGSVLVPKGGRPMTPSKFSESEKVRSRVLTLRDQMAEGYFEMGRLLHRVSKDQLYRQWNGPDGKPYKKFSDYIEREVDFAFRKAKYLMSIWWWFAEELNDPGVFEKIREIGWHKAAMLVGVVDGKNVDKWVEKAKGLGIRELGDECRKALESANRTRRPSRNNKQSGGDETKSGQGHTVSGLPVLSTATPDQEVDSEDRLGVDPLSDEESMNYRSRWTIILDGEQRANIENAIDRASEMAEIEADGKGVLLDFVATAFLAVHGGTSGNNEKEHKVNFRNEMLRSVERILGVDLVAFDRSTMRPLFGENTIDRILEDG